jgi:alkyl hydroperoxide reductase subunit AhpC
MTVRLGDTAPDFTAETTQGTISFHEWLGDSWGVLFSHPKDFTPVCTTELGYVAKIKPEFDKRNVKAIALSVDPAEQHQKWIKDIEETKFLLSDVSDDWRVTVDSHSSSPIFADENAQLVLALNQRGIVDGEYVINNTDTPNKETAIQAFRRKQEKEAETFQMLLKLDPEAAIKSLGGKGHHK